MRSKDIHFENGYAPFRPTSGKPDGVRPLAAAGGVEDRLRLVAFAELQARDLFRYGAEAFATRAPPSWIADWLRFAEVEDRHAQMLLSRLAALGLEPGARTVSDKLSRLCRATDDPVLFLFLLSSAEERGMEAGFVLGEQMGRVDPESAEVFARIAREEVEHVDAARNALAPYAPVGLQERARHLSARV
jgi:uncharacterized ferritin-like protein (DUF455 family)